MIEDSLRLEETGESYIWFIQYESRDLPRGPEAAHRSSDVEQSGSTGTTKVQNKA